MVTHFVCIVVLIGGDQGEC